MRQMRDMFTINWNSEGQKALGVLASLNSPFGLWPAEKDNISLRIRWCISTVTLTVIILQGIYDSYLNCAHIENNAENLYSVTFGIIGLSRMIFYYKHRDILQMNVESAVEDWSSEDSKNFSSIMRSCKSNYKKFTQYLLTFGCFASLMYIVKIFFLDPDATISVKSSKDGQDGNVTMVLRQRFLLPVACTFNNASQSLYWIIFLVQIPEFVVLSGVLLSSDGFFIAITSHLCAQFEILKIKFIDFPKLNNVTETRKELSILIARHKHLLKLAKQLETAFSMTILVQIVLNVVILNVAGFNVLILLKKKEMYSAMINASIIQFALMQAFMYSYIGDRLTSQGDDIAQSVYDSEWYSMPTSISKDVIFVMSRTRFPIGLTAGRFFKMTRSTFSDCVKTAASYLSVLRIITKDDL